MKNVLAIKKVTSESVSKLADSYDAKFHKFKEKFEIYLLITCL